MGQSEIGNRSPGLLVAVEGIDGGGKSAVVLALAQWCGERAIPCAVSREPTGVSRAGKILRAGTAERRTAEEETALFLEDRRDHVARVIAPMLARGGVVVLDRYYWSTAAYQGAHGLDPEELLRRNEEFAPPPDLVLLLDAPPEVGLARIQVRGDRPDAFEEATALARVRENYRRIAEEWRPGVAVVLDATRPSRESVVAALAALERAAAERAIEAGRSSSVAAV